MNKAVTIGLIVTGVVLFIVAVSLIVIFVSKPSCECKRNSKKFNNRELVNSFDILTKQDIVTGERLLALTGEIVNGRKDVVWGKYEKVKGLLKDHAPKYVVTHQSDATISVSDLQKNPSVNQWVGCNIISDSNALLCIPLGIADSRWPHGDVGILCKVIKEANVKDKLCYLNIKVSTNVQQRSEVQRLFSRSPWVSQGRRTDYENYLRDLSRHKYAFAPEGNGPDTHRAWECLYLGVIPIIMKSIHQRVCFKNMPILAVNKWEEVTENFLMSSYNAPNSHIIPELRLDYWRKQITSVIGLRKSTEEH